MRIGRTGQAQRIADEQAIDVLLDGSQLGSLAIGNEGKRNAFTAHATGAADAMDVVIAVTVEYRN